jgi:hypothetical protein
VDGLLYANITTKNLSRKDDSSSFAWPEETAGETLLIKLRLVQELRGQVTSAQRTVHSAKAHIGNPMAWPEDGTYQLYIGSETPAAGVNVTADIAYDATAAEVKAAIDALTDATLAAYLPTDSVRDRNGALAVVYKDASVVVPMACADNELWPVSFVNISASEWDAGYVHTIDLAQTAVAATSSFTTIVASAPTVTELQAGGETAGVLVNEIQKLFIPPEYSPGAIQLKRGFSTTAVLGLPTSADKVSDALNEMAESGEEFIVSSTRDGLYIEFAGDMAGTDWALLEVVEFDPPPADIKMVLATNTAEMRSLIRNLDSDGKVEVPLEIALELEDEQTAGVYHPIKFRSDLEFVPPVLDDERNTSAAIEWNQPLSRVDALAHSPDSVMVGHRSHRELIGDGAATSFAINHNLGTSPVDFTADDTTDVVTAVNHRMINGDIARLTTTDTLPAGLSTGTNYYVVNRTPDTLQLSATAGGAAIDISDTGTGTHTMTRNESADAGVHVSVYDLADGNKRVPDNAYTLVADTENSLTISGFSGTPSSNQYAVFITLVGQPATYQAHTHTMDEITGLNTWRSAVDSAISDLQALAPSGALVLPEGEPGVIATWDLPVFNEVLPISRSSKFVFPASGKISDIDTSLLRFGRAEHHGQTGRGGLLPAVHDAAVENVSGILSGGKLPAAGASYTGKVYLNDTASAVTIPGGKFLSTATMEVGAYIACDGRLWYEVYSYAGETTFYPLAFDRELFTIFVTEKELRLKSQFEALFAIGCAVINGNTAAQWSLVLEVGTADQEAAPATTGMNLKNLVWDSTPVLDERIIIADVPHLRTFGVRVKRELIAAADTLTVEQLISGAAYASAVVPGDNNFAIRARLRRFDTADSQSDPSGYVALSGPVFPASETAETDATTADIGKAIITG